jgi:hypothetical protein
MSAGLGDATPAELVWEVAGRLDRLGPPVIYLYERTDPGLEELTVYKAPALARLPWVPLPVGTPDVVIMPASEAHELLCGEQDEPRRTAPDRGRADVGAEPADRALAAWRPPVWLGLGDRTIYRKDWQPVSR